MMAIQSILFYLFATIIVVSASVVVFSKNPVKSTLFLVLSFVFSSGIWLLLEAEFLALLLILVYVGAVMTLFLFVVMMLNIKAERDKKSFVRYLPFAILAAALLMGISFSVLGPDHFGLTHYDLPLPWPADYSNIADLGRVLYTQHVLLFELAAVILLVALIAAIGLTHRGPQNRRRQRPERQVEVKASDRLRIIKMESGS